MLKHNKGGKEEESVEEHEINKVIRPTHNMLNVFDIDVC